MCDDVLPGESGKGLTASAAILVWGADEVAEGLLEVWALICGLVDAIRIAADLAEEVVGGKGFKAGVE